MTARLFRSRPRITFGPSWSRIYRFTRCAGRSGHTSSRTPNMERGRRDLYRRSKKGPYSPPLIQHIPRRSRRTDLLRIRSHPPIHHGPSHPRPHPHPHQKRRTTFRRGHSRRPRLGHARRLHTHHTSTQQQRTHTHRIQPTPPHRRNHQRTHHRSQRALEPQSPLTRLSRARIWLARSTWGDCRLDLHERGTCEHGDCCRTRLWWLFDRGDEAWRRRDEPGDGDSVRDAQGDCQGCPRVACDEHLYALDSSWYGYFVLGGQADAS
ncbi:hypothetical protein ACGC1H_002110 [Rhizoctonia solani]